MPSDDFKVIVVGGGPAGLTAAHALYHAGIDFLVLEGRSSPVIDTGSNLVLFPVGLRALYQLGLLDAINKVSWPLTNTPRQQHDGGMLGPLTAFGDMIGFFGTPPRVLSRHSLTQVLYESLPDEAKLKVLTDKRVSDISPTPDGVTVACRDGTSYDGSIAVGADGTHSVVRQTIHRLELDSPSGKENGEAPFLTSFRCLWMRFSSQDFPAIEAGAASETHGYGLSTQLFAGGDSGVLGIYEKLEAPTRERVRYTQADQDAIVDRWADLPVMTGESLTLRDVYSKRIESGLVNLEEGVVKHWSSRSRFVLVGDAAHKLTPHTGSGCNQGILDVVVLANELHKAASAARAASPTSGPAPRPTPRQIDDAFAAYQETRFTRVSWHCWLAGYTARMSAWVNPFFMIVDRWLMLIVVLTRLVIWGGISLESGMPVFDYLPGEEPFTGSVHWQNPIPTKPFLEKTY